MALHGDRSATLDDVTIVSLNCETCGAIEVTHENIEGFVCADRLSASYVRLTCPVCGTLVVRLVSPQKMHELIRAGVHARPWTFGNVPELAERHEGPPLTRDDLLDLMEDLRDL